jgi:hypothetical protein
MHRVCLLLVGLMIALPAAAAGNFDGTWAVTLDCPRTPDGVQRYSYAFTATVKDGALHGSHGSKDLPGWLAIDGDVKADGAVSFKADGIVNLPDTALKHLKTGSRYSYEAAGKFDGTRGSARRTSGRQCDYRFVRQ